MKGMFKTLFMALLMVQALQAGAIYGSIAEPLFGCAHATQKAMHLPVFAAERDDFQRFVAEVAKIEQQGEFIQQNIETPEAKKALKPHLLALRSWHKEEARITRLFDRTIRNAISAEDEALFYDLLESDHPIFRKNPRLSKAIAAYDAKIKAERKARKAKKRRDFINYLYTFEHLKGTWKGIDMQGHAIEFTFESPEALTITDRSASPVQVLNGTWTLSKKMLQVQLRTITNLLPNRPPFVRKSDLAFDYPLNYLAKDKMDLTNRDGARLILKK